MSENKNIVIQQNNRTDYDKLHPEVYDKNVNLSTENASVWGNTLEEALPKINDRVSKTEESSYEIRDIRVTTKESLGNKWLKTDGSAFSASEYPDLAKVCCVSGYPFGTQTIAVSEAPGQAIFGKALKETNLQEPCSTYINRYHFRYEMEFVEKQKQLDSSYKYLYSFIYYYSTDLINWNTNQFNILLDYYNSTNSYYLRNYFSGIGYENGYWYFSFYNITDCLDFIYGESLDTVDWKQVQISSDLVYDKNAGRYSYYGWDGSLFYKNRKWYTYVALQGRSNEDTSCIAEISCENIDFTTATWQVFSTYFSSSYKPYGSRALNIEMATFLLNEKIVVVCMGGSGIRLFCCVGEVGTTANNYSQVWATRNIQIQQIIKLDSNSVYLVNLNNSAAKITSSLTPVFESPSKLVTLIRNNGEYINGEHSQNSTIVLYTSNTPSMAGYTENSSRSITGEAFTINAELEEGLCGFVNGSPSKVYKVLYGGVLPNYAPLSSSLTSINAFIKALD